MVLIVISSLDLGYQVQKLLLLTCLHNFIIQNSTVNFNRLEIRIISQNLHINPQSLMAKNLLMILRTFILDLKILLGHQSQEIFVVIMKDHFV